MATSNLSLIVRREEGVLVRVLGLVVRRGFEPVRVEAHLSAGDATLRVDMTLESERSVDTLARQLRRLYDVDGVEVLG